MITNIILCQAVHEQNNLMIKKTKLFLKKLQEINQTESFRNVISLIYLTFMDTKKQYRSIVN